jgi:8-oxo-dGTP pyrophosphatase MutT (NUDIX family)
MVPLPPALVERARASLDGALEPVPTRDAATVVLLRDRPGGLEVYLLRRAASMAFAAGMHVFPGGGVDPRDRDRAAPWAGPAAADWARRLGCQPDLARALVCAAVRETFEESGVLLAGAPPADLVGDTTAEEWESDRLRLLDRSLSMVQLLVRRGLVLRADLLRPWAHWVTPEFEPRRYDTRFFVAVVPEGQHPRDVGGEADRAGWLPVAEALVRYEEGRAAMLPPTAATLRRLADFGDTAAVLAAATGSAPLRPIVPRPVASGDEVELVVDTAGGTVPSDRVVSGPEPERDRR